MIKRTLTLRQLSAALGVAENNLQKHVHKGLPSSPDGPRGGKAFNEEECREWLAKNLSVGSGGNRSKLNAIAQAKAGMPAGDDGELGSALEVDLKLKAART